MRNYTYLMIFSQIELKLNFNYIYKSFVNKMLPNITVNIRQKPLC